MHIRQKKNGIDLIRENGDVVSLTANEVYEIYRTMYMQNIRESVVYFIESIDEEEWLFETTKEEVLSDDELIADIVDDINYADINLNNEDALWDMLERYIN